MGKIIRADLANGKLRTEPLPDDKVLKGFVGGYGLAVWYLYRELPVGLDPFSPENKLVMMTGPLTGTTIPSSADVAVVTKNPITGYTLGAGHAHGYWAANLKFAGYDGIILEGASENPVYLWINDGRMEIRDAGRIWGKDTFETIDQVTGELGDKEAKVCAIGPSGENLVPISVINVEKNHQASKGGIGAVMGSKKVKAIAVKGTGKAPVAAQERLDNVAARWQKLVADSDLGKNMKDAGGTRTGHKHEEWGIPPSRKNLTTGVGVRSTENFVEAVAKGEIEVEVVGSWNCDIKCAYNMKLKEGPYAGLVCHKNGGMEPLDPVSTQIGAEDPLTFVKALDVYLRLGLEAGGFGFSLGLLYECYEAGLIGKDRTDGLELNWGNVDAAMELARKTTYREGIGAVVAQGIPYLAQYIGGDAMDRAVQIKGSPINIHDWRRGAVATLLTYAVSTSGPRHEGFGADTFPGPDKDLGLEQQDPFNPVGKGHAMALEQNRILLENSTGVCWFAALNYMPIGLQADAIAAATGWYDYTAEDAFNAGEKICQLARLFNIRNGLKPEDDFNLPKRLTETLKDGMSKGKSVGSIARPVLNDYYRERGWDLKTGKPWRETLKRVGLEEHIKDIWSS